MIRVLVLSHSYCGRVEALAYAVASGARSAGAAVDVRRVPEAVTGAAHSRLHQEAPFAEIADLQRYDAIIVGTDTRFGRMSWQMAAFLDQAEGLGASGALTGKLGAAFSAGATRHDGQETALFSIITNLLHVGMIVVGSPYRLRRSNVAEIVDDAPGGADGEESLLPTQTDLAGARHQGELVARTAMKLFA